MIINAPAYTAVEAAETQQAEPQATNAVAPGVFAEEASKIGGAVVHYSTDYVFDGSKTTPYDETDSPAPIKVYGKTKLAGEQAIRNSGVPHLIFRTAWISVLSNSHVVQRFGIRLPDWHTQLRHVFEVKRTARVPHT